MKYYGYEIKRSKSVENQKKKLTSFAPVDGGDGSITIETGTGGGFTGQYIDMDIYSRSESELIKEYREISKHPEVETAIDDIVNEFVVHEDGEPPIKINLENVEDEAITDEIKEKITEEFSYILKLLRFNTKGHEIVRSWYTDAKIYFHKIPHENTKKGIKEIRKIDALRMRKIKEVKKTKDPESGVEIIEPVDDYYIYMPEGSASPNTLAKITVDAITFVSSGLYDADRKTVMGYLYKAIKPINQLRMIEDAVVVYRISRAPERRIFYIDTGGLPARKAEQYVKQMMHEYRNRLVYDASTGKLRDDKRHMSMLEDFWFARREGSQGTQVETLDGGQNLGEIEDVEYFKKKLYRALNVPISRLEADTGFSLGRSSEITRDELKFSKFIDRLRTKFNEVFYDLLGTQLILKKIITPQEWDRIRQDIHFTYARDSHFAELKDQELMTERLNVLNNMRDMIGPQKYFSREYVLKNVLKLTEEEIEEMDKQIEDELKQGKVPDPKEGRF